MATTPNAAPSTANVTGTGTTATTSTIKITANSTATLAAAQSAIKQATGNASPNTFAVGSTTTVSQTTPGGKFVQGSVTTPVLNAAAASSLPPTNNGVSSVLSVQNILGAAALAQAGLTVFNKISGGVNLFQSLVNNSNAATPVSSTNNVQDPAQRQQAAAAIPSTGSTNNVSDPAQRAQAAEQAATTVTTPNTNSTNNVTDPAQRAQVADQIAINNAQNVGTFQDPAQRQQAAITNADNTSPTPVSTFNDPAQRAQAALPEPNTNSTTNITDPAQRAQAELIVLQNADNTSPAQVSTFTDPAQQRIENQNIVETIKYDGGVTTLSPVNDPSQRAQARQDAIDAEAPAVISTFEDPAQRGAALQEAIQNPGPVSPSDVVDPAQRQQNIIIESEVPATISTFQDPSQRGQAQQEEIQNSAPAAIPISSDPAQRAQAALDNAPDIPAANPQGQDPAQRAQGLSAAKLDTASQATQQDVSNFSAKSDWRVRLSLSPGAKAAGYLYWANPSGILAPLQATDGVIFPYTPDISVSYNATYDPTEVAHSNYKFFTYRGSSVDSITIGCTFTAQDTAEAQYILAVIHFFKSVTKMFYGQDQTPSNGTPPPLCYLSGLGAFQFDAHPLAITNFTYKLPTDVDYIIAGSTATPAGVNRQNNPSQGKPGESLMAQAGAVRMLTSGLNTGALAAPPNFQTPNTGTKEPTYVPTKIMLTITAVPIVTRNDISNKFSLKEYATGALLRGTKRAGGGIW